MDFYPLYNSIRIALISTTIIFFLGLFFAYYISKLPNIFKSIFDVIFTLPLVLPPTVVGFLLLLVLGPRRPLGIVINEIFGIRLVMKWWSGIFASIVVAFPIMYRTGRGAFESFDETLAYAAKTLGLSNTYIFWFIRIPYIAKTIIAGIILSFARALGEYGATSMLSGYIPSKTATISTTVYHYWSINDDKNAIFWVVINILISTIVLLFINSINSKKKTYI